MLNVDGRIDVDAGGEQLLDVLVALGVPAAGDVGVCKFVDQNQLRSSLACSVDVEFVEDAVDINGWLARDDFEPIEQRLGLLATVRLDHAGDDVDPVLQLSAGGQQHLVGLADAGRRTDKNLEPAAATLLLAPRLG